jgi:RES domain-containing protein
MFLYEQQANPDDLRDDWQECAMEEERHHGWNEDVSTVYAYGA